METFNTTDVINLNGDGKFEETKMHKSVYFKQASELYPRLNRYFVGFKDRFKNVTGRLEEVLRDPKLEQELQDLESLFERPVEVIIFSKDHVELESCVKHIPSSRQQEKQPNEPQRDQGITYMLGFIKVDDDKKGIEEVVAVYHHLMGLKGRTQSDNIYLICELNKSFTKAETNIFCDKVKENTPGLADNSLLEHVIVADNVLSENAICKNMELKVIKTFVKVRNFLKSFIRLKRTGKDQTESDICNEVNMTIQKNWPMSFDYFCKDLNALPEIIARTITRKLSDFHLLPIKLCSKLSKEPKFVEDFKSFLCTAETNNMQLKNDHEKYQMKTKVKEYATRYAESLSKRLQKVKENVIDFRKMILEIERILQTSFFRSQYENDLLLVDVEIPQLLLQDLLKIKGVTGVGTIAGVLEVHVNSDEVIENVRTESFQCFEKHNYEGDFDVKPFARINKLYFAVSCGDEIGNQVSHVATLGLVVRGSDEQVYGLTSGHAVVDSSEVFGIDQSTQKKHMIGVVQKDMTLISFKTDIAAIKLIGNENESYYIGAKDSYGIIREAKLLSMENERSLTGSRVFKHGAATGLTYGIIVSDNYVIVPNNDASNNCFLISTLCGGEDKEYLQPGDSGSVNCLYNDSYFVEVLSMNAGEMTEVRGVFPERHHLSYPLAESLEELGKQSGVNLLKYLRAPYDN